MAKRYKVASMFAGIGGICLGFKNAGADIIWANEIDKYACINYRNNFKEVNLIEDDIQNIDAKSLPDFDILTSGFPCQAFSIAGYRKGFEDERGHLFFETLRVLKEKKPRAFLIENVKNLVSHDGGKTFKIISDALKSAGYYIRYQVLNTMDYGNIPQNRERIYIVGFKNKDECDKFYFPGPIMLTKSINDIIDKSVKVEDKYYYNKDSKYFDMLNENVVKDDTIYQLRRTYVRENKSKVCPTLTANMGTGGHNVPLIRDCYGIRKLTPKECLLFQGFPDTFKIPEKLSDTQLYKQAGNSVTVPVIERIAKSMIKIMTEYDKDTKNELEGLEKENFEIGLQYG